MDHELSEPIAEAGAARCQATTRSGQPCRNHALAGQAYCRMHAPAEPATLPAEELPIDSSPSEELLIELAPGEELELTIENAGDPHAAAMAEVQELEVKIHNQSEGQPEARAMAASALRLIRENLQRMAPEAAQRAAALLRQNVSSDYLDPDFWRGISMVLRYQVDEAVALIQRRRRGEYSTDEFGMDMELVELVRPFSTFMYRTYWRVSSSGLEHVPSAGPALLVANHGGVLPWDSMMIATAVLEEHSSPRVVRSMYPAMFRALPGVTSALTTFGQVADTPENGQQLLDAGELVCVFPEGASALGKLFRNRYKLQRFRRSGSAGLALRAGAPIVPVAVVGSEETYPVLADASPLAHMLRLPFFPLTPLFPWLGPLGLLPLPTKWSITFGEPIDTSAYGPASADDPRVLGELAEELRRRLQALLDEHVTKRTSLFR